MLIDPRPAPSWRCPRCRTLQPEATRCWRCDQPAFACETCTSYRASVAVGLGYCAQDPDRRPLRADEMRSCWQAASGPEIGGAAQSDQGEAAGLFLQAELASAVPAAAPATPDGRRSASAVVERPAQAPLGAPGRAAWVEQRGDGLVEAPTIEPEKRLTTELQRRRSRWSG